MRCYKVWQNRAATKVTRKLTRRIVTSDRSGETSLRRKFRALRNDISLDWRVPEAIRLRRDTSSTRIRFPRSSRCDRNIIDSRELSRLRFLCLCVVQVWRCYTHNNSIRIFPKPRRGIRGGRQYRHRYFRDTGSLSPCTCWLSLNRKISVCGATSRRVFSILWEKKR